jgi:hypothetical protein
MAKILVGRVLDSSTDSVAVEPGVLPLLVQEQNQLVPEEYDYIELSYTGADLTGVIYKTGGSGGATVATLVLTYSGGELATVTRT